MRPPIALTAAAVMATVAPRTAQAQPLLLGGWNDTRGGSQYSIVDGSENTQIRSAILSGFPGVQVSGTSTLTSAYLSTVNVLFISDVSAGTTYTTALSAAEQSALTNFVLAGKGVLIFTDNDTAAGQPNSSTINNSYLAPFGLHATGTINGYQPAAIGSPAASPVTSGPFGTVTTLTTYFPGWYDNLGSATGLGILTANAEPALAVLPPGALGSGSGPVIFFSDSSFLTDNILTGQDQSQDQTAVLNAIAYANPVPEPGSLTLAGVAIAGFAACRRRFLLRYHFC